MFHISPLEQDITKKKREFSVPEFEPSNDKEYKIEAIRGNAIYAKEADRYLPKVYYLVA